jgi:hypothetical protein
MNELIQKLSSYVESQYGEDKNIQYTPPSDEVNQQDTEERQERILYNKAINHNHNQIHNSIVDLYNNVDKNTNRSAVVLNSGKVSREQLRNYGTAHNSRLKQNGNKTVSHNIELKKNKEEYSRNDMIYRSWWDKNAHTFGMFYSIMIII